MGRDFMSVSVAAVLLWGAAGAEILSAGTDGLVIFSDDFESGDVSNWSDVVSGSCGFVHCWLDPLTHCAPSPGCSFTPQRCFMGELVSSPPQDRCADPPEVTPFPLPEFADCAAVGLRRSDPCGTSSLCVQMAPADIQCRDLCAISEGPLGSTDHPDCRRAAATCLDIGHPEFGVCE